MNALATFDGFSEYDKFACVLSQTNPEFILFSDWVKRAVFNQQQKIRREYIETISDSSYEPHINNALWSGSVREDLCMFGWKTIAYSSILEEKLSEIQTIEDFQDANQQAIWGHSLFQSFGEDNTFVFSEDIGGENPVFVVQVTENGSIQSLQLQNQLINLETGQAMELNEKPETDTLDDTKVHVDKPTSAQLRRYKAINTILKTNSKYVATKSEMMEELKALNTLAISRGIDPEVALSEYYENHPTIKPRQDEKPTAAQLRRYRAMNAILETDTRFIPTKAEMISELQQLDSMAVERGIDPKIALGKYFEQQRLLRKKAEAEREATVELSAKSEIVEGDKIAEIEATDLPDLDSQKWDAKLSLSSDGEKPSMQEQLAIAKNKAALQDGATVMMAQDPTK